MDDIDKIRAWLLAHKKQWPEIAKHAGLSTKTVFRFAHDPEWNFELKTVRGLRAAMDLDTAPEAA